MKYSNSQILSAVLARWAKPLVDQVLVSEMHHTDLRSEVVQGAIVGPEEAMMLLDGMDEESKKQLRWDAYAAANAFMHDLGNTGMDKKMILEAARLFWFHDEDFPEKNKVYWYFGLMLF